MIKMSTLAYPLFALGWMVVGVAFSAQLQEQRLPVVADNSIATAPNEVNHNAGAKSVLRIKGIQHILTMKFDLSTVRGWRIHRARLYLHSVREHRLRTIGLSTIASDWNEGKGVDATTKGGSCFTYAVYPNQHWAGEQSDFTDVSFGVGNTLYAFVDLQQLPDGWLEIDVPPKLVSAMKCKASFGLAVSDEKGQTRWNNDVHSREKSQFAPYFVVEGEPADGISPPSISDFRVQPEPNEASFQTGAVSLTFTAPAPNVNQFLPFAYHLEIRGGEFEDWRVVPRYRIPYAEKPGKHQSILVPGLIPSTRYEFRLTALDEWGYESEPVFTTTVSSPAKFLPKPLHKVSPLPQLATSNPGNPLFAVPDTVKVDPVSGDILEAKDDEKYRQRNPVWDGRTIHLAAAHNEIVAFQLIVKSPKVEDIKITDLNGANEKVFASRFRCYRVWYVREGERWFPEVALPLGVQADNRIPNQRYQSIWVDLFVPKDVAAGEYRGNITVTADGVKMVVPLKLRLREFSLPDRPNFVVDLNGYGPVARMFGERQDTPKGIAIEHAYHRLARKHRCVLNLLPYSQSGATHRGWVPSVKGEGGDAYVVGWRSYDAHYGQLFDGTAFADLTRNSVPLRHQYLPFHENYPMPINQHYWGEEKNITGDYPDIIERHALKAPLIEQAFTSAYIDGYKSIAREFVRYFREKGWTQTEMQFYLNNKHYYKDQRHRGRGTSWWLLDEPMHRDDFLALIFFGRLFKEAVSEEMRSAEATKFIYRCDVSRPQWVREPEEFLQLVDVMCVSWAFFRKNKRCMDYRKRYGIRFWHYGTANRVGESNLAAEAWGLKAFLLGADGILPWNSIGSDRNFERPEPTALLYPGKRFDINEPLASLRLKALRRAQQDVEYLIAFANKFGYDREQLSFAVAQLLDLTGRTEKQFVDDAGRTVFEHLQPEDFFSLRHAISEAIE